MRRSPRLLTAATALATSAALLLVASPAGAAAAWTQADSEKFNTVYALQRSQGAATDGTDWFFSWKSGLSRVSMDYSETYDTDNSAIPEAIADQGGDHIGDIAQYAGKLYAPIEDKDYAHPWVCEYSAATLDHTGVCHALPVNASGQTHASWIAVDPAKGLAYTTDFDGVSTLRVLRLSDFSLVRTVPLSATLDDVQGGDLYEGQLYLTSNDGDKSVNRVDPVSGQVTREFEQDLDLVSEAEGVVVLPRPDGSFLHTLDVSWNLWVNFRSYKRG